MVAAVNDLSFENQFSSKREAVEKVRQWMKVCKKLEAKETTAIEGLYSVMLNTSAEIAQDYPFIQLVKEFQDHDDRRYLIHLLTNLNQPEYMPHISFCMEGKCSCICAWARDAIIASIESDKTFEQPVLHGKIAEKDVFVKNISRQEHILLYEQFLGIRHYEANKKHRKQPYYDAAGRYVDAMDLDDAEAQKLLESAVEIEGNMYGKKGEQYYCFQRHHANYYHGYQNNELGLHIRNRIDEENWE